jgi:hypothetical protein
LLRGATNEIVTSVSPATTETVVGASGTVDGVTALEALESADVPIPFVAVTLNV